MTTTQTPVLSQIGGVPTINGIAVYQIFGATGPHGILSAGDLIGPRNLLAPLSAMASTSRALWREFDAILPHWNTHRSNLASLLKLPRH